MRTAVVQSNGLRHGRLVVRRRNRVCHFLRFSGVNTRKSASLFVEGQTRRQIGLDREGVDSGVRSAVNGREGEILVNHLRLNTAFQLREFPIRYTIRRGKNTYRRCRDSRCLLPK